MLNKTEMNLMEKVMNGSIELKMEIFKNLKADLEEIQTQIAQLIGAPAQITIQQPVVNMTPEQSDILDTVEEHKKENHKASVHKLVKCGASKGEDEVLFVDKRRDMKHLWYGQIRIDNQIRNFHMSDQLEQATVYGVNSLESLEKATKLIVASMPKDAFCDLVPDVIPDSGAFKARYYMEKIAKGAYLYMTPKRYDADEKDSDIIFKGYIDDHAFIVRRSGKVFWRNYNYIFSKKPFEATPSKGYNAQQMEKEIQEMIDKLEVQFNIAEHNYRLNEEHKYHPVSKPVVDKNSTEAPIVNEDDELARKISILSGDCSHLFM